MHIYIFRFLFSSIRFALVSEFPNVQYLLSMHRIESKLHKKNVFDI